MSIWIDGILQDETLSGASVLIDPTCSPIYTGTVTANDALCAIAAYVESGVIRIRAVIDYVDNTAVPPSENDGDRFLLDDTGVSNAAWDGGAALDIMQFNGTSGLWESQTPEEGMITYVDVEDQDRRFIDDGVPTWEIAAGGLWKINTEIKTVTPGLNIDTQGGTIKDLTASQLTLDDDVIITGGTNAARTIGTAVTGTTYTFALTDKNDYFEFSNATGIAVTLEANSVIAFGVGNEMEGRNSGAGAVVITPAVGVTINGATSAVTISSGAFWALKQITVDSWHFIVSLSSSPTFTDLYVTGKLTVDGLIDPTALVLTPQASPPIADNGTVYYNSDGSFKFRQNGSWATSSAFTWSVITAGQSLVKSNGYFTTGASQLLLPLPTLSAVGDTIEIKANNANGFKITQGAGQVITQGNTNTTVGITGFLESTAIGDSVRIVCSVANTQWDAFPIIGVLNGFI
jgi:hypothetical protein